MFEEIMYACATSMMHYLNAEDVWYLMQVNCRLNDIFKNKTQLGWEDKVKQYFPLQYQPYKSVPNIHWFHTFNALAARHYAGLERSVTRLFLASTTEDTVVLANLQGGDFYHRHHLGHYLIQSVATSASPRVMGFLFEKYILPHYKNEQGDLDFQKVDLKELYTLLTQAARLNQLAVIGANLTREMVARHQIDYPDANSLSRPLVTPLQMAAGYGHVEAIQQLLALGADVNFSTLHHPFTPLHCAALFGHLEAVDVLLKAGAEIDSFGRGSDVTPLYAAASNGMLNTFNFLREKGALLQPLAMPPHSASLLHYAVHGSNFNILNTVIHLFDINVLSSLGETPLHWAARNGNDLMYDFLLQKGADPAIVSGRGSTVLHFAVQSGCVEMVQRTAECKLLINTTNIIMRTPLQEAVIQAKTPKIVRVLLEAGADPRLLNEAGNTALHEAVATPDIDDAVIEMLIAADATAPVETPVMRLVNTIRYDKKTPLDYLCFVLFELERNRQNFHRIDLLLAHGAVISRPFSLSRLRKMNLQRCTLSRNALFLALTQAPYLTNLNLSAAEIEHIDDHASVVNADDIHLPMLEVLQLKDANMAGLTASVIAPILSAAPQLKKFVYSSAQLAEVGFFEMMGAVYEKTKNKCLGRCLANALEKGESVEQNLVAAKRIFVELGVQHAVRRIERKLLSNQAITFFGGTNAEVPAARRDSAPKRNRSGSL